ncbi:hypothetical protein DSO57_1021740 [Entomophthora muscae]|uniref:Uncharacterized protein n=1 Tax=Entomophthora muscae TaxID=34485 RepID=A0ACC2RI23_9FUNG|nr:hypothetical protein DSO57_1021740 [Entomophthora muscae]
MAFQAQPASPLGVQPDSSMGYDIDGNDRHYGAQLRALVFAWAICIKYYQVSTHPMVGITCWHGSTPSKVT